eukprot:2356971-Amphidinium_carterae.1
MKEQLEWRKGDPGAYDIRTLIAMATLCVIEQAMDFTMGREALGKIAKTARTKCTHVLHVLCPCVLGGVSIQPGRVSKLSISPTFEIDGLATSATKKVIKQSTLEMLVSTELTNVLMPGWQHEFVDWRDGEPNAFDTHRMRAVWAMLALTVVMYLVMRDPRIAQL